jgi:hypothetical protein
MQGIRKQQLRMDLFHRISLQHVRNRMTQVILSLPYNTMPRMPSPTHVLIAYPAFYNILNVSNKGCVSIVFSSTKTSTLLSLPLIENLNSVCEFGATDSAIAAVERLPSNQHRPPRHIADITTAATYGIRPSHDMPPPHSTVLMSPCNIRIVVHPWHSGTPQSLPRSSRAKLASTYNSPTVHTTGTDIRSSSISLVDSIPNNNDDQSEVPDWVHDDVDFPGVSLHDSDENLPPIGRQSNFHQNIICKVLCLDWGGEYVHNPC